MRCAVQMVGVDATPALAYAAELFLGWLTTRAWDGPQSENRCVLHFHPLRWGYRQRIHPSSGTLCRRTLQRRDIVQAIETDDRFSLLVDLLPDAVMPPVNRVCLSPYPWCKC